MQEFLDIFAVINTVALIMFITGLLLLVVEIFIPGFGIAGISGIILLVLAAVIQAKNITQALILIVLIGLIVGAVLLIFFRSASKGTLYKSDIVLKEKSNEVKNIAEVQPGDIGTSLTTLRPAGMALINGIKYDVISQGDFITKDMPVKVISVEGNKIIVRECPN